MWRVRMGGRSVASDDEPDKDASIVDHVRHRLLQQLDTLKRCDPGVRLCGDVTDVHRIRVAARRMRTILIARSDDKLQAHAQQLSQYAPSIAIPFLLKSN